MITGVNLNCSETNIGHFQDIRLKQHALEVKRVWELVTRDPHLKRLGDWLVNEEEKTQAEKWRL